MTVTNSSGKSRTSPVWSFTTGSGGPVNQPPVALNQSVTALEDTATAITLMAFDQNDDQVTFTVVDGPTRGTLSGIAPTLIYQPAANFNGTDSFTIRANDGQATSDPGTDLDHGPGRERSAGCCRRVLHRPGRTDADGARRRECSATTPTSTARP